jgi:hypothetical protein
MTLMTCVFDRLDRLLWFDDTFPGRFLISSRTVRWFCTALCPVWALNVHDEIIWLGGHWRAGPLEPGPHRDAGLRRCALECRPSVDRLYLVWLR